MEALLDTVQLDEQRAPRIFKPGQFVVIRVEMTAEDDRLIKNSLARMRGQGKQAEMQMLLGDAQLATMQAMITGWGGITRKMVDPQGRIVEMALPYSADNVRRLPKPMWDYVYAQINELNPDMSEAEQSDFLPSPPAPTGASSEPGSPSLPS